MVYGTVRSDETLCLIDDGVCHLFDKMGRYKGRIEIPPDVAMNKREFKAVSVVSTVKDVVIGVFDEAGITEKVGTNQTVMDLTSKKGYIRRLMLSSVAEGIRYTQMVFVYDSSVDVKNLV